MYHSLKVAQVDQVTTDAIAVKFEIPSSLQSAFKFIPGQFLGLRATVNGEELRRSYSICSSPASGEIQVAIKRVEGGKFSSWATKELKPGAVLDVAEPSGRFTVSCLSNNQRNYVFVAAGSGITPVMSMVRSVLVEEPLSKVILLYGNKSPEDAIFKNELEALQTKHQERFSLKFVYSRSGASEFKRIAPDLIQQEVASVLPWSEVYGLYLCGPQQMIEATKNHLPSVTELGSEQIHFELFQVDSKAASSAEQTDFEKAKVTVTIDEVEYTFEVKAGTDILSSGLEAGIDIPYSCQGGVCGTCECKVEKGAVELNQNMVLSDEEVEEGQALACQAVPKTPEVKLYFGF